MCAAPLADAALLGTDAPWSSAVWQDMFVFVTGKVLRLRTHVVNSMDVVALTKAAALPYRPYLYRPEAQYVSSIGHAVPDAAS